MSKFFNKFKKPLFGPTSPNFWAIFFWINPAATYVTSKRFLSSSQNIEKKLIIQFKENIRTDRRADRKGRTEARMDRPYYRNFPATVEVPQKIQQLLSNSRKTKEKNKNKTTNNFLANKKRGYDWELRLLGLSWLGQKQYNYYIIPGYVQHFYKLLTSLHAIGRS